MNVVGILTHIANSATANYELDRYGFSKAPRRYTYANNSSYSIYSDLAGRSYTVTQFDEISESAERRHGDFHSPTPYYIAQTQKRGRQSEEMKVSSDYRTIPLKRHLLSAPIPRSGSVDSFGFLTGTAGKAASLLNAKILDAANQWSAAVDAAELGQTVGLFRSLSKKFLGISLGVVQRDPHVVLNAFGVKSTRNRRRKVVSIIDKTKRSGGTVGDAAADLWLEYRYGIRPLVRSLEDYQAALTAGYDPSFEVQVTYPESLDYVAMENKGTYGGYAYHILELGHAKRSVRMKAQFSFRDSLQARILGNPLGMALGTAWELISYSFVLDWIVKVGDWINQLNLETLVANYKCVRTTKGYTRFTGTNTAVPDPSKPYAKVVTTALPKLVFETRSFRREVLSSPSYGTLMWGSGLSPTLRQLDAGSLLFAKVRRLNASSFR